MPQKVRVAIVGLGFGAEFIPIYKDHPDAEMVVVHQDPQQRLALYMSGCDVLAFPSRQEGSPNIIKQAMACNLPIVATPVGDIPELIGGTEGCHVADDPCGQKQRPSVVSRRPRFMY